MKLKLTKNKIRLILGIVFVVVLVLNFGLIDQAQGGEVGGIVDDSIRQQGVDPNKVSFFDNLNPIVWILQKVLRFVGFLLSASASLFAFIIDPNNLTKIIDNKIIYTIWEKVRDALNIFFILGLLFCAFATVFQVSKFNYKNVLLTIILMALLVNFSFPIARVIIDFSNVIMYYFIKALNLAGKDGGVFSQIIRTSGLGSIVDSKSSDVTFLIAAIVFSFIFAITLLTIAVLLLIRVVVLAILIIFSPIAFVGAVIPFLSSESKKWWDALFKYSFFGPIMAFMLYISVEIMKEAENFRNVFFVTAGIQTSPGEASKLVGSIAFFSIPLVILWVGIGFSQKLGITGAGAVIDRTRKWGKALAKSPSRGAWWIAKKTGVPGATKQWWEQRKKEGVLGSERTAQREAKYAAKFFVKGAEEKDMKRRAEEYKKNHATIDELKLLASKGDAAAAYRLAEDKDIDQATYENFIKSNQNKSIHKAVNSKVKQNRADIVANYIAKQAAQEKINSMTSADINNERNAASARGIPGAAAWSDDQVKQHVARQELNKKVKEEIGKLTAEKFADQDWSEITKGPINPEKRRSLRGAVLAIHNMAPAARAEAAKRMSPANRAALKRAARSEFKLNLAI